jgi:hypothetical protein
MKTFVKVWSESIGTDRFLGVKSRDNGIPIEVGTGGIDQGGVATTNGPRYEAPLDWNSFEELSTLLSYVYGTSGPDKFGPDSLTGESKLPGMLKSILGWKKDRDPNADLSDEEKSRIEERIRQLQDELNLSPNRADATGQLRYLPVGGEGKE